MHFSALALYLVSFFSALLIFIGLGSFLFWRRRRARSRTRYMPSPGELRRRKIPVIESVPFCVPNLAGNLVDIEIQPSIRKLAPLSSSTPMSAQGKSPKKPKVKFSIQYHRQSSQLVVELLDIKHMSSIDASESESNDNTGSGSSSASDSLSTSPFTTLQIPEERPPHGYRMQRGRGRQISYAFEMTYEEIQLQSLQFCVMGYDDYSRERIVGDVLLPLAELSQQGYDITRELVLWRDIQSRQPRRNTASRRDTGQGDSDMGLEGHTRCNQS